MESSTKKILAVAALLLLAGGAFAYYRNKKSETDSETSTEQDSTAANNAEAPKTNAPDEGRRNLNLSKPPVKTKPLAIPVNSGVNTGVSNAKIVNARDILAGNIKGADAKPIYALKDGVVVYNMKSEKAFVAKKNQYLGVCSYSRSSGSNYIIYFVTGAGALKYWTPATSIGVKIN